jgi:ribosomal protein L7/L12
MLVDLKNKMELENEMSRLLSDLSTKDRDFVKIEMRFNEAQAVVDKIKDELSQCADEAYALRMKVYNLLSDAVNAAQAPVAPVVNELNDQKLLDLFNKCNSNKINIVREMRTDYWMGLKEAKDMIEAFAQRKGLTFAQY